MDPYPATHDHVAGNSEMPAMSMRYVCIADVDVTSGVVAYFG
jgi:hypothetical protein